MPVMATPASPPDTAVSSLQWQRRTTSTARKVSRPIHLSNADRSCLRPSARSASARTRNARAGCSRRGCHRAAAAECRQASVRLQDWLEGERVWKTQLDADPKQDQELLFFGKAGGTSLFRLRVVPRVRGFTWDLHPLNSLTDFVCHFSDINGYLVPILCQFYCLSSSRVFLTKMHKVLGSTNGLTPLLKGGGPGCSPRSALGSAAARNPPGKPRLPENVPGVSCNSV